MITNFKIFEKEGDKFNIGTWVLLSDTSLWHVYPYVKIIDKESTKTHRNNDIYESPLNDYEVETFSIIETGEVKTFWVDDFEIERELTQDEIEQTKAKFNSIKYNI